MSKNPLVIGLFGFGVVGEGLYKVLQQTPSLNATIKKVVIKHADKKRNAPAELFTQQAADILEDNSINVVVELIDDADAAYHIVTTALKKGKAVVSANKKLIAEHLEELIHLQQAFEVPFLYEAAACASIPVIRNLEEYYDNDLLQGIAGIVNGSTNFILHKIHTENLPFDQALKQAQALGFAESNPFLDVSGTDAANKLTILLAHAYGIVAHPSQFLFSGISNIQSIDAAYAAEKNYHIKLVAKAQKLSNGKIAAYVLPQFVTNTNALYNVHNEYNGVIIKSGLADEQFFFGKGAGSFPTASAVISDISALRYQYKYEYKKKNSSLQTTLSNDYFLKVYVSFNQADDIQREDFEWLEAYHSSDTRSYLIGVIAADTLFKTTWWTSENVSVILMLDQIIENIDYQKIKRKSLELAGIL